LRHFIISPPPLTLSPPLRAADDADAIAAMLLPGFHASRCPDVADAAACRRMLPAAAAHARFHAISMFASAACALLTRFFVCHLRRHDFADYDS
jgi:hypothetical protein